MIHTGLHHSLNRVSAYIIHHFSCFVHSNRMNNLTEIDRYFASVSSKIIKVPGRKII